MPSNKFPGGSDKLSMLNAVAQLHLKSSANKTVAKQYGQTNPDGEFSGNDPRDAVNEPSNDGNQSPAEKAKMASVAGKKRGMGDNGKIGATGMDGAADGEPANPSGPDSRVAKNQPAGKGGNQSPVGKSPDARSKKLMKGAAGKDY